jgi:hypothetical protein
MSGSSGTWMADTWSSRTYSDGGTCSVVAGAGGAPFYSLAALKTTVRMPWWLVW